MESQIVIKNQLINYFRTGELTDPAVILLHGWGSSANIWGNISKKLSEDGFLVYSINLPGFGKSSLPEKPFSVSDYMEIIKEFIIKQKISRPIVIGHSLGGRITIKLSSAESKLVYKNVLVDSAGLILNKSKLANRNKIASIVKPFFKPKFMHGIRKCIYQAIGSEDYVTNPELKDTLIKILNEDLKPYLNKISQPTLIIWGENDLDTPIEAAKIMHREINQSKLVIIKDAGHYSFIDQPKRFFEELIKFLKQ